MREGIRWPIKTTRDNMGMELAKQRQHGNATGNAMEMKLSCTLGANFELNLSVSFSFLQSDDRFA